LEKSQLSLEALRQNMRSGDIFSLPFSGMILWSAAAVAGLYLNPLTFAYAVLFGTGAIFPLGVLISRVRGLNMMEGGTSNPLTGLFLLGILVLASLWPLIIWGAKTDPTLVVLGAALIAGNIWIIWGWTAGTNIGLHHALGRMIGCYLAYKLVPEPLNQSAICVVVVLAYFYSLIRMRSLRSIKD